MKRKKRRTDKEKRNRHTNRKKVRWRKRKQTDEQIKNRHLREIIEG